MRDHDSQNLRLGRNFPREALHSRKKSVWIGLSKPKTVVVMFSCKLCTGNMRAKTKIRQIIRCQVEVVTIEHGRVWKGK